MTVNHTAISSFRNRRTGFWSELKQLQVSFPHLLHGFQVLATQLLDQLELKLSDHTLESR